MHGEHLRQPWTKTTPKRCRNVGRSNRTWSLWQHRPAPRASGGSRSRLSANILWPQRACHSKLSWAPIRVQHWGTTNGAACSPRTVEGNPLPQWGSGNYPGKLWKFYMPNRVFWGIFVRLLVHKMYVHFAVLNDVEAFSNKLSYYKQLGLYNVGREILT